MTRDLLQPDNKVNEKNGTSSEAEEGDDATGVSVDTSNESPNSDERVETTSCKSPSTKMSCGRPSPTSSAKSRNSIPDPVVYEPPERRRSANISIQSKDSGPEDSDSAIVTDTVTPTQEFDGRDESSVNDTGTSLKSRDLEAIEDHKPEQDGEKEEQKVDDSNSTSEDAIEGASNADCSPGKVSRISGQLSTSEEEAPAKNVQDKKEIVAIEDGINDDSVVENPVTDTSFQNAESEITENEGGSEVPTKTEPSCIVNGDSIAPPEEAKDQEDDNEPTVTIIEQDAKPEENVAQNDNSNGNENRPITEMEEKSTNPGDDDDSSSIRPASKISDRQDISDSPIAEPDMVIQKEELPSQENNQDEAVKSAKDVVESQLEKTVVTSSSIGAASDETRIEISIPAPPIVSEESILVEEDKFEPTRDTDETSSNHKEIECSVSQDKPQQNECSADLRESPTIQPEEVDAICNYGETKITSDPEDTQEENKTEDDPVIDSTEGHNEASSTAAETSTTDEPPTPIEYDESKNSSSPSIELLSPSKQIKRPSSPKRLPKAMISPRKKNGVMLSPTKTPDGRKLPPIKAPVGLAPNPNLKNIKSKIGSFDNIKYKPGGGDKKVITMKLEWKAAPKIGSLDRGEKRKDKPSDESKDEQLSEESPEQESAKDFSQKIDEELPVSA